MNIKKVLEMSRNNERIGGRRLPPQAAMTALPTPATATAGPAQGNTGNMGALGALGVTMPG